MATIEELVTKYEEVLENTQKSVLGLYNNITQIQDDIDTIEDVVMPQLESDMNSALSTKASVYSTFYGFPCTVVTTGNYGISNLTEWSISSGGGEPLLTYYSSNSIPIHLEDFHEYTQSITLDNPTLVENHQILVTLADGSFNYSSLSTSGGDDIRFYDSNGVECDYWIENWVYDGTSHIWVEIPTTGTTQLEMRFGNDTMSAGSSGNNTFDYFWDFTNLTELPDGWEELTWTNNTVTINKNYVNVEVGGMYYQLPDIQIQDGYVVGNRVEYENYTTGNASSNWSAMSPGIFSDKPQVTTTNLDKQSGVLSMRYYVTPNRLYMYAGTGDAGSWDAYSGSYETSVADDTWYTIEIGIDENGYFKRYWDHTISTLNPGQDTYYKPMNYISLSQDDGSRAGVYQDCINTHFKYVWVRKFPDYSVEPASTLGTTTSGNSWINNDITMTQGDEVTSVEVTSDTDPYHSKILNFSGIDYSKVTMNARVTNGSDNYLRMSYRTTDTIWHSAGNASAITSGGYSEVEWDMSSDSNWVNGTIDRILINYANFEIGDIIEFTEIKVTDDLNENASFYADSFSAAYLHLNKSLGTGGTYGLKAMKKALTTGKLIQERNKTAISNALNGYSGIS
jgi:hypothetical protein